MILSKIFRFFNLGWWGGGGGQRSGLKSSIVLDLFKKVLYG